MEQETPPGAVNAAETPPQTPEQPKKSKFDIGALVGKVFGMLKSNPASVEAPFSRISQDQLNREFGPSPAAGQPSSPEAPSAVASPTASLGPEHTVGQAPVGTEITHIDLTGTTASGTGPEHDVITPPSKN